MLLLLYWCCSHVRYGKVEMGLAPSSWTRRETRQAASLREIRRPPSKTSMSLGHLRRAFPEGEVHLHRIEGMNGDRFAPDYGIGENRTLHANLRRNVIERIFADHPPSFVPGNDLIIAGRNLGELEVAILIGHCIVGMLCHYHFAIHPDMYVAAHAYCAFAVHGTRDLLPLKNKGEVVIRAARHLHGVQQGIAIPHGQSRLQRHQQDMRFVAAAFLVEEPARRGQIHRFPAGDVPEKYDRIGYATVRGDQQPFQVTALLPLGVANLRVSVDFGGYQVRQGSLPLHGSLNRSTVLDGDDLIARLGGTECRRERDHEHCERAKNVLHTHHLERASPGEDTPVYSTGGKHSHGRGVPSGFQMWLTSRFT